MSKIFSFFILVLLVSLIFPSHQLYDVPSELVDLMERIKNDKPVNENELINAISIVDSISKNYKEPQPTLNRYMGRILSSYAKKCLFGEINGKADIQKAHYFFKLASNYGNAESLYYLGFLAYYELDGKFLFESNYEKFDPKDKHPYFTNYFKKMDITTLATNAYLASAQKYAPAQYLMANLYNQGKGFKKECTSAALYLKELGKELFMTKDTEDGSLMYPFLVERKRLDNEYFFFEEKDGSMLVDNPGEVDYISLHAESGDVNNMLKLGNLYYHGLRGVKQDYEKAFKYFRQAEKADSKKGKLLVAQMLLEGKGTEKNVEEAVKKLKQLVNENDGAAKNLLGTLYYNGEGVEKDEIKAYQYFKEAVDQNITEAYYNFAVATMNLGGDMALAKKYIAMAAAEGNSFALFHYGLMYLEGSIMYYHCETGFELMRTACSRGKWAGKLHDGYDAYKKGNYKVAVLNYLEASLLGYEMAGTNAGILIQKYNVFDDEDLNILGLDSRIKTDKLYLALSRTSNFQPPKNLLDLFFGEIFERIYTSNSSRVKKDDFIRNLTKVESGMGKKYGNHILLKALKDSAKVGDNMAKMVLGDIYQSGVIVPRDYNKSYDYYYSIFAQAIRVQNVQIESHAMFSIAYFYHYGLGVDKNLTKAINIYNDTLLYKGSNYYLTLFYMKMAQIEKQYYESYRNETTNPIKEKDITLMEMISFSINEFERKYTGKIAVGILGVAAVFLFLVRLRLKNYVDLYLKEHPEHN